MDEDVLSGIASGFNEGSRNFLNAMTAVKTLRMQQAKHDIDIKKAKLDLKKMEIDTDPETVAKNKEILDLSIKKLKTDDQLKLAQMTNVMRQRKQQAIESAQKYRGFRAAQILKSQGQRMLEEAMGDPAMKGRVGVSTTGLPYLSPEKTGLDLWGGLDGAGAVSAGGDQTIRVRNKQTGQTGKISASKFNPEKYERLS